MPKYDFTYQSRDEIVVIVFIICLFVSIMLIGVCSQGKLAYMSKEQIKKLIETTINEDGLVETGVNGVQLFRVSEPVRCAPAVYEPSVVAIVSGTKDTLMDGNRCIYDKSQYLCCSTLMPVETGTPDASPDNPLLGVYITLDPKVLTELIIEMERAISVVRKPNDDVIPQGLTLSRWDDRFCDSLLRLLKLGDSPEDTAVLGNSRLRELYYAVLQGDAGDSVRRAFGLNNEIARSIMYLSERLQDKVTIDEMASQVGMSRAVFHRKFKQVTTMSPMQFVKSMRLNRASIKIAAGMKVNEAAFIVGYVSSSQFNRDFKRQYGKSPKQWSNAIKPSVKD